MISKLLTYEPSERLTAIETLRHPFFQDLFSPDDEHLEGDPVNYYDFEFEQYSLNSHILKELILDEIIMSNSKEARKENRKLRVMNPNGVLE